MRAHRGKAFLTLLAAIEAKRNERPGLFEEKVKPGKSQAGKRSMIFH